MGFDGGTVAANALKGRYVLVGGKRCKVVGNTASQLTLDTAVTAADNDVIYPGEGGSQAAPCTAVCSWARALMAWWICPRAPRSS